MRYTYQIVVYMKFTEMQQIKVQEIKEKRTTEDGPLSLHRNTKTLL